MIVEQLPQDTIILRYHGPGGGSRQAILYLSGMFAYSISGELGSLQHLGRHQVYRVRNWFDPV